MDSITKLGQVKIGNETWTAKTENDTLLSEGDTIRVDSIEGVKAIVSKI